LVCYEEVNTDGMSTVRNDYNQEKRSIENDLYTNLKTVPSLEFDEKSTEIFYYTVEDRFKVRDIFYGIACNFRPIL
jgi:hypothetical protein